MTCINNKDLMFDLKRLQNYSWRVINNVATSEKGVVGFDGPLVPRRSPRHTCVVFLWLGAMGDRKVCRFLGIGLSTRCCPATFSTEGTGLNLCQGVQS